MRLSLRCRNILTYTTVRSGVRPLDVTRSKLACRAPPSTHLTQEGSTWDGGGTCIKIPSGRGKDIAGASTQPLGSSFFAHPQIKKAWFVTFSFNIQNSTFKIVLPPPFLGLARLKSASLYLPPGEIRRAVITLSPMAGEGRGEGEDFYRP